MKFQLKESVPGKPAEIYNAWLDSKGHSKMTGSPAKVSDKKGESFTAWDGYISGENVELVPNKKIVQHWRTTEFAEDDEDSLLEITFKEKNGETEITIKHSNLPEHGMQYKQGWIDSYITPMRKYFG